LQKALDAYFPELAQDELPVVFSGLKDSLEYELGVVFTKRCVAGDGHIRRIKHIRLTSVHVGKHVFSFPSRAIILISTHYAHTTHPTIGH
jgi:hypothetical protein